MSGEMLFAPGEKAKSQQKEQRQEELGDYRKRLHNLAMTKAEDLDTLAKDRELDFLLFEGIVMGHVDGNSPNVINIAEHLHKRMEKLEEVERNKKTSKKSTG